MATRNNQETEVTCQFSTKDINFYVCQYIKHCLGGFDLDDSGRELKYLLKNKFEDLDGSYRAFYTEGIDSAGPLPFDYHFDKTKQRAPKSGESDNRKDVFDELTQIMLAEENCRAKIMFPNNKADNHWLVGELVLDKKGTFISVLVFAHDPYGQGKLSNLKFKLLKDRLKKAFVHFDVQVRSQISPYTSKRLHIDDVISSGVVVADELIKRIANESLTLSTAYPIGARQLRECQISRLLEEVCSAEAQSYIENIALTEDDIEESKQLVLSVRGVSCKLYEIVNDVGGEKTRKLRKIEEEFYKPLVKKLASNISFEELMDLVIVFDDLSILTLVVSDLNNQLDCLTEAAVYCQYIKTILEEKFSAEQRIKFLERHCNKPYQRWSKTQEKFLMKVGGKIELLPHMTHEAEEYRKHVFKMRNEATQGIESIEKQLKTHSPQDMNEQRNSIVQPVRDLFENIANKMKSFLAKLYNDSEALMVTSPPCRYAIIGLGSLALQQITPYSDFEFAILTELDADDNSEISDYFKNLSNLANLKIISLGETGIPFSKFKVDLDHLVHVGINFDLGGKTPLGRVDKFYSLIKTVPEMLKYVFNKDDKISHIDKNLPYILENVCYVAGDKELVEAYQKKVSNFLNQTNSNDKKHCEVRAFKILEEGAVEFDYANKQPNLEPKKKEFKGDIEKLAPNFTTGGGKHFNVKQEIYRLSERMVYNLGLYFGIEGKSCWDTIDKLKEAGIINESAQKNLQYAVSFANLLRLKTYFKNKSQTGEMSIYSKRSNASESSMLELTEDDLEENGELFNYFYRAFPLYRKLKDFCSKHKELTNSEKQSFFQNEPFFDSSPVTKGLIYYRLNQFENALRHLTPNHDNQVSLIEVIGSAYQCIGDYNSALQCYKQCLLQYPKEAFFLDSIGHACFCKGDSDSALQYYKESLDVKKMRCKDAGHPSIADSLTKIGGIYDSKGEHDLALQNYKESLDMYKAASLDPAHPGVTTCLNEIGLAHQSKGEYDLALQYFNECLILTRSVYKDEAHPSIVSSLHNVASVFRYRGDYDSALQYFKECLDMSQTIYKGAAHPELANTLNNIGFVYHFKGNYVLALRYHRESFDMQKALYEGVAHTYVADTLHGFGNAYHLKGDYDLALQYYKESLDMRKLAFKNAPHPFIAADLNSIGGVYLSKRDHSSALQYYEKSLEMLKTFFKGTAHPEIAIISNNIGGIYDTIGEYDLALRYYKESLEMKKKVFKDAAHPSIANSLNNIAGVCRAKGDYALALRYFKECLDMQKSIFADVVHPGLATCLNNIGGVYDSQGDFDAALQFYQECLDMHKVIYKEDVHPSVARTLNNIGGAYSSKGDYDMALQVLNASLEMNKSLYKDGFHPDVATCLHFIAVAYFYKGNLELALQYYEECLAIRTVFFNDVHPDVAECLNNIGHVYNRKGDYDLALQYFKKSLNIFKAVYKNTAHPNLVSILNSICSVHQMKGEYDLARPYIRERYIMENLLRL